MKQRITRIIAIMALTVFISAFFSNSAFASEDAIQIYRNELAQMASLQY